MENVDDILKQIHAARRRRRDSLKGVERMQYNLFLRHRGWMMRNDNERCVTVGEVVNRVMDYAPKTITRNREEVIKAVEDLWSVTHAYSIASDDYLRESLEEDLSFYFQTI